jgi:phosphohistidine phosphatase
MQLYIMRHGEAQNAVSHSFASDSERELTQQGKFEAQLMAHWLIKMKVDVTHLWVSPFFRAQQTCAIISEDIDVKAETLDFITPEGDAKQVHDYIDAFILNHLGNIKENDKSPQALFIVSHMPLVSYLVAELTNYQAAPIFATAGIAEIDYNTQSMRGELVRLISPLDLCE